MSTTNVLRKCALFLLFIIPLFATSLCTTFTNIPRLCMIVNIDWAECLSKSKSKVTIRNHQADSPLYVWPNVWSGDW